MGTTESTTLATPPYATTRSPGAAIEALQEATLGFFASSDASEIAGMVLNAAGRVVPTDGVSLWVPRDNALQCAGALGEHRDAVDGERVDPSTIESQLPGEDDLAICALPIDVEGTRTAVLRATRGRTERGAFSDVEHELLRHLCDSAGAAIASARRLSAAESAAKDSARDLDLITQMSREITSTLDLDRVLRSVVNLASRALEFDRGAVGLYERGACDIRAVAGAESVDSKDPALQDLAVRAAWAAGHGEPFYLSDRTDPASDAERMFAQIFGEDLERDDAMSALYIPLKDEEGIVGILLFEASDVEFANDRQRGLASILANQATVAIRNARLYHQVPLVDALGFLGAHKTSFLALPRQRRIALAVLGVVAIAAVTLIRWPLRVSGDTPAFRPLTRADVRPTIPGVIDRVFVREGTEVARGAPIAHLRDDELRAAHDAAVASVASAERSADIAAARGDAAAERVQRLRVAALQRDVDILAEQLESTIVRAPVSGVVLTPRPEEKVGAYAEQGDVIAVVGRTDSLELDFGVDQRDVALVRTGDEVRLRVTALPQHTFSGRVTAVAPVSTSSEGTVLFPVRAVFANSEGLLKPGMGAYARVLTEPASVVGRVLRDPIRAARLLWWRMWA